LFFMSRDCGTSFKGEDPHVNDEVKSLYRHEKALFRNRSGTPAASQAHRVARLFVQYYRLPESSVDLALTEHPKGTIILDENGDPIVDPNCRGRNLSLGRRSAVYFRLPTPIPSLGLKAGQFIGFVGDRKVLNSSVGTRFYLLCVPFNSKQWRLIGVVQKDSGRTEMSLSRVRQVVLDASLDNGIMRNYPSRHECEEKEPKRDRVRTEGETVVARTEVEVEAAIPAEDTPEVSDTDLNCGTTVVPDGLNTHVLPQDVTLDSDQDNAFCSVSPEAEQGFEPLEESESSRGFAELFSSTDSLDLPVPQPYYYFEVKAVLSRRNDESYSSEQNMEEFSSF